MNRRPPPGPKGPISSAKRAPEPETLPRVKPGPESDPLPRFPTEDSVPVPDVEALLAAEPLPAFSLPLDPSQPVVLEPESFDAAPTRQLADPSEIADAAPTKLRDRAALPLKPASVAPGPALRDDAALDDVVEELREATGGKPATRELSTSALVDESPDSSLEPANSTMEVNVSELMIDKPAPARDLWNVRQAQPRAPMHTVRVERPKKRSGAVAIVGVFLGAGIVFGVLAFLYLRSHGGQFLAPPAPTATTGTLELPPSAKGQKLTWDGHPLEVQEPLVVACGVHRLGIGDQPVKDVDVPCGGTLRVP